MNGLDAHFANLDRRYQLQIDAKDSYEAEREELELAAEADFKDASALCDMSAPMRGTEMPVNAYVNGKYCKTGTRCMTLGEVTYDFMDNAERSDRLLRALYLCAKAGQKEAIEAINEVEAMYVKTRVDTEMECDE